MKDITIQPKQIPLSRTLQNQGADASCSPTHDDIARRAYEIFIGRGGQAGTYQQDWMQAERELCVKPIAPVATVSAKPSEEARPGNLPARERSAGLAPSEIMDGGSGARDRFRFSLGPRSTVK